jgi:hypothetical protein
MVAGDNGDRLPPSFSELQGARDFSPSDWEIVSWGVEKRMGDLSKTILVREKTPGRSPDGKFVKAYAFVDGHGELLRSQTFDFTQLEKQRGLLVHLADN